MKSYVYKITNILNNKIYIGKANNIAKRWSGHKSAAIKKNPGNYTYLHRAMNRYNFDNFKIEQIGEYDSEKEAYEAEEVFISKFNTTNRKIGYNIEKGGYGGKKGVRTFTKEDRERISVTRKNNLLNTDIKNRIIKSSRALLKETCLEIQKKYLTEKHSVGKLSKEYKRDRKSIKKILKGKYLSLDNFTKISNEEYDRIEKIHSRKKIVKIKNKLEKKVMTTEIELNIMNDYITNKDRRLLSKKYNFSISKIGVVINKYISKADISKKLSNNIIHDYTNENLTIKDLRKKYKKSGRDISKVLNDNNINIIHASEIARDKNIKNIKEQYEKDILNDYLNHKTMTYIQEKYKTSYKTISSILKDNNLHKDRDTSSYKLVISNENELLVDYAENSMTIRHLAEKYNISCPTVKRILNEKGIIIKKGGKSKKNICSKDTSE